MKNEKKLNLIIIGVTLGIVFIMVIWGKVLSGTSGEQQNAASTETASSGGALKRGQAVEEVHTLDISVLEDHFESMGFLITQEYDFKDVMDYKEAKSVGGWQLPFTESSFVVTYEGAVTAGVDFTAIKVAKDDETKTITVTIPEAEIKNVDIDPESMEVIEEKNGVLTSVSITEFNDSLVELEEKAKSDALEKNILTKADENAKLVIENLVSEMLLDSEYSYTIVSE